MTIGNASKMVDSGSWQTLPQPHLPKSLKEYKKLYTFGFQYKGFKFLCNYLKDIESKETCWFVFPFYKDFSNKIIVFSDEIRISKYWQRDIYNMSINNDSLKLSGPGWLPASLIPTIISKNPDFSSPLLYCSTIFYVCALICLFKLIASTLAFIARYRRGIKMSTEVFLKDLSKLDLYNKNINSPITSSTSVTKDNNNV